MTSRNYQQATWPARSDWDGVSRDNYDPSFSTPERLVNYDRVNDPSRFGSYDRYSNPDGQTFMHGGRRCRIVCDPPRRPPHRPPHQDHPQNLVLLSRSLIGKPINVARSIYPNVRVVVADGRQLPTTMDYNPRRINVETRNNIIIKIVGFY